VLDMIRAHSGAPQEDTWTFTRALMLNWLIGGADVSAKNFSMLIGAGGRARLAPLYNLASRLPWPGSDPRQRVPSTPDGTVYAFDEIGSRHWLKFAAEVRLPAAQVLDAGRDMAARIPDALRQVADQARVAGINHPIIARLVELLSARAERCARLLAT